MKTSLLVAAVIAFFIFAISLQIDAIRVSEFDQHRMQPKRQLIHEVAKSDHDVPRHARVTLSGNPPIVNNKDDEAPPDKKSTEAKVANGQDHKNEHDDDDNESYGQYGSDDSSSQSHHYYSASKHSGSKLAGDAPAK